MSRRKPKTLADAAQRYAERVCKRQSAEALSGDANFKLELVLAYMAGALSASSNPLVATPVQKGA